MTDSQSLPVPIGDAAGETSGSLNNDYFENKDVESIIRRFLVTNYNATGDGETDDTSAIQDAIDAAIAAGAGSEIIFPPGNYVTAGAITVASEAILTGRGRIEGEDIGTNYVLRVGDPDGAEFIILDNLDVASNGEGYGCIRVERTSNFSIRNTRLRSDEDTSKYGVIVVDACCQGSIRDCKIDGYFHYGIIVSSGPSGVDSHSLTIDNVWVNCNDATGSQGILFNATSPISASVKNCRVEGTMAFGFNMSGPKGVVVENLYIVPTEGYVGYINGDNGQYRYIYADADGATDGILVAGDNNTIFLADWDSYPASGYQVNIQAGANNNTIYCNDPDRIYDGGDGTAIYRYDTASPELNGGDFLTDNDTGSGNGLDADLHDGYEASEMFTPLGVTATATEINNGCDGMGVSIPRVKVVQIGDWNMDSDDTIDVAHGLTMSKIVGATAMIISDDGQYYFPMGTGNSGTGALQVWIGSIRTSIVRLRRLAGGDYDSTDYNATSFNRGYVILFYIN